MLTLYHGDSSVCSQKVRVGLAEKGLSYDGRMIDIRVGEQFDPDYMKLNPNAVVPTLVHDGKVVIESSVILQYLDDAFPEVPLMPKDDHLKALVRVWLLRSLDLHGSINTMSFATAYRERELKKSPEEREAGYAKIPSAFRAAKKRDLVENGLKSLHVEVAADILVKAAKDMQAGLTAGKWLVGDDFSLADVGLISYIDRLHRLGLEGFWADCPRVADWYDRMRARKSYAVAIEAFQPKGDMRPFGDRAWPQIASLLKAA